MKLRLLLALGGLRWAKTSGAGIFGHWRSLGISIRLRFSECKADEVYLREKLGFYIHEGLELHGCLWMLTIANASGGGK